jgi:glutamine synthetase
LAAGSTPDLPASGGKLELGASVVPPIARDNTDRNRTSPFAFTGNKFEFRAVGSSASISFPTTVLNVAVADGIRSISEWISGGMTAAEATRKALQESAPVRFDGNNYAADWITEAERRGLPHARNTPSALEALATPAAAELFAAGGVLSHEELHARYEVRLDTYSKKVEIEADMLQELVDTQVAPAAIADAAEATRDAQAIGQGFAHARAEALVAAARALSDARAVLSTAIGSVPGGSEAAKARYLCDQVVPAMAALREACDALEGLVSDARWPLPRYRELLFPA